MNKKLIGIGVLLVALFIARQAFTAAPDACADFVLHHERYE